ncbi:hypothetical protein FLONG3_6160 [Fusarium longipes]|uniref:Uncharacterized protein n=1 Tax=Fusarium longipes TaxID=694270 RepID=A0A395SP68_9HYPO|nr:hypothetical protein FLONG3_6160 [Fusarium longipes]
MSSFKKMFSLSTKKDEVSQSNEARPTSESPSLEDYKLELEKLREDNALLRTYNAERKHDQLRHRHEAFGAVHESNETCAKLEWALRSLKDVDRQLGAIFNGREIKKAVLDATRNPENDGTQKALKELKLTEIQLHGTRENVKECIKTLKGFLKE